MWGGGNLSSHLSASDNLPLSIGDNFFTFSLSPQKMAVENNLLLESGVLWPQPFPKTKSYFPYANLGLRYQYSNLNNDQTLLRFKLARYTNNDLAYQLFSDSYYDFAQHSLLASVKLDLYRWQRIMPYLSAGLGTTWHRVRQKTPLYLNLLSDKVVNLVEIQTDIEKKNNFSYSFGAGFDFPISDHFWLSLGYQYNHLGNITFKPKLVALDQKLQEEIKKINIDKFFKPFNLKNLHTQTIQLTGRYLFG